MGNKTIKIITNNMMRLAKLGERGRRNDRRRCNGANRIAMTIAQKIAAMKGVSSHTKAKEMAISNAKKARWCVVSFVN